VISADEATQSAGLEGDSLILGQSLRRAEARRSVEMVAEALLTGLDPARPLLFEVERGHIGSTQVEISSCAPGMPTLVAVLTWDGIAAGERNICA
jgi:hypothetical protein